MRVTQVCSKGGIEGIIQQDGAALKARPGAVSACPGDSKIDPACRDAVLGLVVENCLEWRRDLPFS